MIKMAGGFIWRRGSAMMVALSIGLATTHGSVEARHSTNHSHSAHHKAHTSKVADDGTMTMSSRKALLASNDASDSSSEGNGAKTQEADKSSTASDNNLEAKHKADKSESKKERKQREAAAKEQEKSEKKERKASKGADRGKDETASIEAKSGKEASASKQSDAGQEAKLVKSPQQASLPKAETASAAPIDANQASVSVVGDQAPKYEIDTALLSVLKDITKSLKESEDVAKLEDPAEKLAVATAIEALDKSMVLAAIHPNRIIASDLKSRLEKGLSAESWDSGELALSNGSRASMSVLWAKKINGMVNVSIAGNCGNKATSNGGKAGEFIVIINGKSTLDSGFDIQSQSNVDFWLGKLTGFSVDAGNIGAKKNDSFTPLKALLTPRRKLYLAQLEQWQTARAQQSAQDMKLAEDQSAVKKSGSASDLADKANAGAVQVSANQAAPTTQSATPKRAGSTSVPAKVAPAISALPKVAMQPPPPAAPAAPDAVTAAMPTAVTAAVPTAVTAAVPTAVTAAVPTAVTAAVPTAVTAAVPTAVTAAVPTAVTAAVPTAVTAASPAAVTPAAPESLTTSATTATPGAVTPAVPEAVIAAVPAAATAVPVPAAATLTTPALAPPLTVQQPRSPRIPSESAHPVAPERAVAGEFITVAVLNADHKPEPSVEICFNGAVASTSADGKVVYQVPEEAAPGPSLQIALSARPEASPIAVNVLQPLMKRVGTQQPSIDHVVNITTGPIRSIIIDGHNFDGIAEHNKVMVDGAHEAVILVASPVQIKALVPPAVSQGQHNVTVTTNGLKSNLTQCELSSPRSDLANSKHKLVLRPTMQRKVSTARWPKR